MGHSAGEAFGVEETHGILWRPENRIYAKSDGRGWSTLYASAQREAPYEADYPAVKDHLIVLHMDGPVGVTRRLGGEESRRVVAPGGLFLLPGGVDFGVKLEGELDSLHVYLRRELVEEVAADLGLEDPSLKSLAPKLGERDPLIERLALGVREALNDDDHAAGVYVDYLSRALAARLLREHSISAHAKPEPPKGGLTPAQIERVTEFLEANLDGPITLPQMAAACGLSPTHFARRFKAAMGIPPHQHLMQLRVERAKRLLQGSQPIVEVALACGFAHQEHLTRVFRRQTGYTPASFRRDATS